MSISNEVFFDCPYCGEQISMMLEPMEEAQTYIEDCEVCCRPIEISFMEVDGSTEIQSIKRLDD